jgi:hypothetical protein
VAEQGCLLSRLRVILLDLRHMLPVATYCRKSSILQLLQRIECQQVSRQANPYPVQNPYKDCTKIGQAQLPEQVVPFRLSPIVLAENLLHGVCPPPY